MKKILLLLILLTASLSISAQSGKTVRIYQQGGSVDTLRMQSGSTIEHSFVDESGVSHSDYVSIAVTNDSGTRHYPLASVDSIVLPTGRTVVFHGYTSSDSGNRKEPSSSYFSHPSSLNDTLDSSSRKRTSFSGKFPGGDRVIYYWTENDHIRLDVGYESRAKQLSNGNKEASFMFEDADLESDAYTVYYPDKQVTIQSHQTQTGANNTEHIGVGGDCGIADALRQPDGSYSFSLVHKASYLCFLPHINHLPSAKVTRIELYCADSPIAGQYMMSGAGLYGASNTSYTIALDLVPRSESDFFIGHDTNTEQDSCAAYMVIAPQSTSRTFQATYYVTDTLSRISKVYRQSFSFCPQANTVYPITFNISDNDYHTINLGLSCCWSNVNVGADEPGQKGIRYASDTEANAALLSQTVVTQWLMPDADQCDELLERCTWTRGVYNGSTGYLVEGASVSKAYHERLRIFLPCEDGMTPAECLSSNYRPVEVLMIDLGLPSGTKWAARNVGANNVEDYGDYFAWGETEPKTNYTSATYKYGTQSLGDNYDISGTLYDAAVVNWGGLWRMPTKDQMQELVSEGSWQWSSINGVNGYIITGTNGNKIFLPSAGFMEGTTAKYRGNGGTYFTSKLSGYRANAVWTLYWQKDFNAVINVSSTADNYNRFGYSNERPVDRYYGRPVRPVTLPSVVSEDGNSYTIVTDSAVWKLRDTKATLYATLSSSLPIKGNLSVGFVVGDSAQIDKSTARFVLSQVTNVGGSFKDSLDVYDNVGYWYRAYLEVDGVPYYGDARHYGYEFVDLGLSSGTKWANMNVGASQPSDYGNYYAWGETDTKTSYTSGTYKYGNQSLGDDYDIAGTEYDAAHVNMGGAWRMPTKAQMQELYSECTWTWTSQDGVNGYRVTGKNDKSIFLPAAGFMEGSSLNYNVRGGTYFSSTLAGDGSSKVWTLYWQKDYTADIFVRSTADNYNRFGYSNERPVDRYYGRPVRAVSMPTAVSEDGNLFTVLADSAVWKFNETTATLYGTLRSSMPVEGSLSVGFVVGDSAQIDKSTARFILPQEINAAGVFHETIDVHDNVGYWYRAYLEIGNKTYYSDARHYGYEYVDLGLTSGTKWANMNVGALQPSDYGDYYAWGETETKASYTSGTYKYGNQNLGENYDIAGTEYDAAHVIMGGAWRMPTKDQMQELKDECTWTWTSQDGINGYRVTGKNGKSIFLPAAGFMEGSSLNYNVRGGTYFSSTLAGDRSSKVWTLYWQKGFNAVINVSSTADNYNRFGYSNERPVDRYYGRPIRPVAPGE